MILEAHKSAFEVLPTRSMFDKCLAIHVLPQGRLSRKWSEEHLAGSLPRSRKYAHITRTLRWGGGLEDHGPGPPGRSGLLPGGIAPAGKVGLAR